MKKIISLKWFPATVAVFCLGLLFLGGCRKEPLVTSTSTQVNITGYLENNPDQFSEWKKILDITGNSGFLQAYGNYTMFLPSNDGVKKFLTAAGKTSVEQIDLQELKNIVRLHLLEDTISTRNFGDGKLNTLTMLGQYLITGATIADGVNKVVINRQANLQQANIRLGNGYIHVIDNVLSPAKLTLAKMIEADPNYSILTQALKETGLYDSLNIVPQSNPDPDKKFLTVLAESNQVLTAAGYGTYAALKAKYNTGNPDLKHYKNGLHAYVAYHILFDARYLADLASAPFHATLAEPEIIQSKLIGDKVVINELEINGTYEPGLQLDRSKSDISASNGVLQSTAPYAYKYTYKNTAGNTVTATGTTTGQYEIKARAPYAVYWDLADFPEARKNPNFRKAGGAAFGFDKTSAVAPSPIKGWNWPKTGNGVTYNNAGSTDAWVFRDYLNMFLGNISGNARQEWIDMKTPFLVRGDYHVWICYRRQTQSGNWPATVGTTARVRIDGGDPSPRVFHFAEPPPTGSTAELEGVGWKYYTSTGVIASPFLKQTYNTSAVVNNSPWVSKDVGIMSVKTSNVHTLRMEAVFNSQNANNMDMIHFIPVGWPSQILPRFKVDGTEDNTNYPGTH